MAAGARPGQLSIGFYRSGTSLDDCAANGAWSYDVATAQDATRSKPTNRTPAGR
jgi:hypothetical protein